MGLWCVVLLCLGNKDEVIPRQHRHMRLVKIRVVMMVRARVRVVVRLRGSRFMVVKVRVRESHFAYCTREARLRPSD